MWENNKTPTQLPTNSTLLNVDCSCDVVRPRKERKRSLNSVGLVFICLKSSWEQTRESQRELLFLYITEVDSTGSNSSLMMVYS